MKLNYNYYLDKILTALRVRSFVGGIEISDLVIRFVYFDGKVWHLAGVRLEPGIIEGGRIKNRDQFISALQALKSQLFKGRDLKKKINAVVSLSSINVYSQVFSLPIIEGENLEKAIQLNIQMVSPVDASQAYSGWQMAGEDKGALRLEVLSAFIDKNTVDELNRALFDGGFAAVAVESRALALSRLFREQGMGFDDGRPYVLLSLDNSGIDFLIIRHGQLYFEYFNPWRDIAGDKGEIEIPAFRAAVTRSLHQVMNFYGQHWPEPLKEVILSATALKEEIKNIIADNFSLSVRELGLKMDQSIGSEWFVALGCGIRGTKPRGSDKEVTLLGIGVGESFHREQLINFLGFWRLLVPLVLGLLLLAFVLSDLFLIQSGRTLEAQTSFGPSNEQNNEHSALSAQALDFNRSIKFIESVRNSSTYKGRLWTKVSGIASASGVVIDRFTFSDPSSPMSLSGRADSEEKISFFRDALTRDPEFSGVNLPFSGITSCPGGSCFSLTFQLNR